MIIGSNMKLVDKCDNIRDVTKKDYCYFENVKFFEITKDLCDKISAEDLKIKCNDAIKDKI